MKAIILAGGFGTRLRERVPNLPKPMAPVAGTPFLQYILDHLIKGGIHEIILSVGYRADVIISHFQQTYHGASISYAIESEPLGTGGAVAHALKNHDGQPIIVVNGDTFVNIDYFQLLDWYRKEPYSVALVLKEMVDLSRYGSVIVSNGIVSGFLEKGNSGKSLINAGIYILSPTVFKTYRLTGRFSLERDLIQQYCHELAPRAFLTDEYFIDIGVPDDYERAQYELPKLV